MAPRAYWKGYLKLSLVSCPVALFPASSEREKISFNQINKKTGNRIRYRKVDAETEEEGGTFPPPSRASSAAVRQLLFLDGAPNVPGGERAKVPTNARISG